MKSGIYHIVNTACNATYIGSSRNMTARIGNHRKHLRAGSHRNDHLQRAWLKYGEHVFEFEQLILCDKHLLAEREQRFIDAYYLHRLELYNHAPSAKSYVGFELSAAVREKIRAAGLGRKHSEETKLKIGRANKGRPNPAARLTGLANKGRRHSIESRARMSLARKGRKFSEEHKANMRKAFRGRYVSPERIAAMNIARKIKRPNHMAAMSEARKRLRPNHIADMNAARLKKRAQMNEAIVKATPQK